MKRKNRRVSIQKESNKPEAMMEKVEVDFVSLVDKGANKKKFAIFKSQENENEDKQDIEKFYYDDYGHIGAGSSFKGAVQALETAEGLRKSRQLMDEYFFLLKMAMKGVLDDQSITNKSTGIKKAKEEFKEHGINVNGLKVDFKQMINRKAGVVESNTKGIDYLYFHFMLEV